jgi:hypothetical protein
MKLTQYSAKMLNLLLAVVIAWLCLSVLTPTSDVRASDGFKDGISPVFQSSCVKCHGDKGKVKGRVNLHEINSDSELMKNPELLEKLIDAVELGEMPPEKEQPLTPRVRAKLVAHFKVLLRDALRAKKSTARTPIRRMTRFQYNNAVQDLFQLKVVVFPLPERMLREHGNYFQPSTGKMPARLSAGSRPLGKSQMIEKRLAGVTPYPQDLRAEHGFDNRGDHLSLSPLLMESFISLSRSIVESEDFHAKTCGIWNAFFLPPKNVSSAGAKGDVRDGKRKIAAREKQKGAADASVNEKAADSSGNVKDVVADRLRSFLTLAFRRPVSDTLLDRYVGHVMAKIGSGETFVNSMKSAASAAIASPRFLYVYDKASVGEGAQQLDDFDLASRLSFFLWGSIPDEALLALAKTGKLHDRAVLIEQVGRMLHDRKLKRFCDSFPAQWLQLERIISSVPDPKEHPNFYFSRYRASMHMMLEPLLVFETVLIENRSILDFVDSDFSYRSALLDGWYKEGKRAGGPPTAIPFRRVKLTNRREGGLITNAAVMTMTSGPVESKPITRGAWIAAVIFNDPPEPPPGDVPPLPGKGSKGVDPKMTLRERLALHRERADCAGCHEKIDPLGFALENYGPTGLWRDQYENGRSVDVSGVLFRKYKFTNIIEFKDAILAEKERFARAFAAHLISFAIGREVNTSDAIALDRIVAETKSDDYKLQAIIKQIVLSEPFLSKYSPIEGKSQHEK